MRLPSRVRQFAHTEHKMLRGSGEDLVEPMVTFDTLQIRVTCRASENVSSSIVCDASQALLGMETATWNKSCCTLLMKELSCEAELSKCCTTPDSTQGDAVAH